MAVHPYLERSLHRLVCSLLLLGALAAQSAERAASPLPPPAQDVPYEAVKGDTMIGIARRYLVDGENFLVQRALWQHNEMKDPDVVLPGQRIRIPFNWIRSEPASAEVVAAQGEVQTRGQPARTGGTLKSGDDLRTGRDGYATIKLVDGSTLVLQPGSTLEIERINKSAIAASPDAAFLLRQGRLETKVQPRAAAGPRFEVRTPLALGAVRGTEYRVAVVDPKLAARFEVTRGAVAVNDSGNRGSVDVPEGYGTLVPEDAAPLPPRALLAPPSLWTGVRLVVRQPANLQFVPIDGAAAYRFFLFQSNGDVVRDQTIDRAELRIDGLPNGDYLARVRGVDDIGLEGRDWVGELWLRVPR